MARTDLEQLVYQMSSDISQLVKANKAALDAVKKNTNDIQNEYDKSGKKAWHGFTQGGDEAIRLTRNQSMELMHIGRAMFDGLASGANPIRLLAQEGGRLSEVLTSGPGGIAGSFKAIISTIGPFAAAAAPVVIALAALSFGFKKAGEDMKWARELQATVDRIGGTAEQLQIFRIAAQQSDVPVNTLEESIQRLNGAIGAVQTGVGATRMVKAFKALDIEPDQLKHINDAYDLLPLIAERLDKLGSKAEQVQIAKKLGIEGLLPMLKGGSAGLKDLTDKAEGVGTVSNDTTRQLAEMSKQAELAHDKIDIDLKKAFVDLAPVINTATEALANFLDYITKKLPDGSTIGGRALAIYRDQLQSFVDPIGAAKNFGKDSGFSDWLDDRLLYNSFASKARKMGMIDGADQTRYANQQMARVLADRASMSPATKGKVTPEDMRKWMDPKGNMPVDVDIPDYSTGGKGDHTLSATAQAQAALDAALKNEADAAAAFKDDIMARAADQKAAVDAELKATLDSIAAKKKAADADKHISAATKAQADAQYDQAVSVEKTAADLKKRKIDVEAQIAQETKNQEIADKITQFKIQQLEAEKQMATTAQARADIDLQIENLRYAMAKADLAQKQKFEQLRAQAAVTDGSTVAIAVNPAEQKAMDATHNANVAKIQQSAEGPLAQWLRGIQDIDTTLQSSAVGALQTFNQGLARFAVEGGKGVDVLRQFINQLLEDMIEAEAQQAEKGILTLLGFDGGGYTGSGSRSGGLDGKGGFLAVLHPQETVIDHTKSMIGGLGGSPDARSGASVAAMALSVHVEASPYFDARVQQVAAPMAQQAAIMGAAGGAKLAQVRQTKMLRNAVR